MSEATAAPKLPIERIKLGLFALFGLAFLGLAVPAFAEPMTFWTGIVFGGHEFPTHEFHHFILGSIFTLLFLGVIAQVIRPTDRVGALHSSIIIWISFTLVFSIGGEFSPMFLVLLGLLLGMAATHPSGRAQVPSLDAVNRPMAVVAGLTAIGAVAFAWIELSAYFTADDAHVEFGHYLFTATTGLSIAALALYGSVRGIGWRFPTYTAAFFMAVIGLGSIAYPGAEQGSSLGVVLGLVVVLWTLLFVVLTERGDDVAARFRP